MTKFLVPAEMTHLPHERSSPQVKDARHSESGFNGGPGHVPGHLYAFLGELVWVRAPAEN